MRPKPRHALAMAATLALAASLAAESIPKGPALPPLFDNGHSFLSATQRLPLRCLDAPDLMGLPVDEQAQRLDRAAAAGFNSVSFEAPLFGPQGLCRTLGQVDDPARQRLAQLLEACALRQLYALPVLYPPSAVQALDPKADGGVVFFAGRNALGWQAWALREAAKCNVRGVPLTATAVVAGWILFRGPWPDGSPVNGRPTPRTPTAQARLRAWTAWQVKLARRLGFRQELGLGLWPKTDLGANAPADGPTDAKDGGPAPVASLSTMSFDPNAMAQQTQDLDALPPVPGADAEKVDDSATVPSAPASPWDLEGLDWTLVDGLFQELPPASQIGFLEFSLDSEDWYRVGDRLAEAAARAEVPVLWRQDWRNASRYERSKRLAPPAPVAGLEGPWPEDDWPAVGENLWPGTDTPSAANAPFYIRSATWSAEDGKAVLDVQLTRPSNLLLRWGRSMALDHSLSSPPGHGRPKAEHHFVLEGVAPGSWVLLRLEAHSPVFGDCGLRTRWMRVPR